MAGRCAQIASTLVFPLLWFARLADGETHVGAPAAAISVISGSAGPERETDT